MEPLQKFGRNVRKKLSCVRKQAIFESDVYSQNTVEINEETDEEDENCVYKVWFLQSFYQSILNFKNGQICFKFLSFTLITMTLYLFISRAWCHPSNCRF